MLARGYARTLRTHPKERQSSAAARTKVALLLRSAGVAVEVESLPDYVI